MQITFYQTNYEPKLHTRVNVFLTNDHVAYRKTNIFCKQILKYVQGTTQYHVDKSYKFDVLYIFKVVCFCIKVLASLLCKL